MGMGMGMGMGMVGGGKAGAVMVSTSSPSWCVGRIAAVAAGGIVLLRHKPPSSCYLLLHHRTIIRTTTTAAATTTRRAGAHLLTPQFHPLSLNINNNNNNNNNKRRSRHLPFFLRAHSSSSSHHNHDVNEPGSIDSPLISSMHSKIKEQLNAESVIVKDAYGDGRHVSIDVISSVFEGESAVSRQRMVYKAIWEELQNTVHAVDQMTTKTPSEAAATNK